MGAIANIKETIANLYLRYKLMRVIKNKTPNKFSFDNAKTIAILFDSTDKSDYELMKKYVSYLREYHKKVKVIGFYNVKEVPDFAYSKLEYDFFSIKSLNLIGKPKPLFVEQFIEEEFDLLIDLNLNNRFPLKYISSLSKAQFKVGNYSKKNTSMYDLMIDISKTPNLKYFMQQVDVYLAMINKSK